MTDFREIQPWSWQRLLGYAFQRRKAEVPDTFPFQGKTVIVGVHAGGLGDNLAYSALPRLYKNAGASKVLISTQTNYGEAVTRNDEVRDLVWRLNPFVDGFTDEPANVGERGWPPMEFFRAAKTSGSPIETVATVHGLSIGDLPTSRTFSTVPLTARTSPGRSCAIRARFPSPSARNRSRGLPATWSGGMASTWTR